MIEPSKHLVEIRFKRECQFSIKERIEVDELIIIGERESPPSEPPKSGNEVYYTDYNWEARNE